MKWQVSPHAVDRFIERVDPSMTYKQAERILSSAFPEQAIPLRTRTLNGQQRWEMVGYPAILVTKRDGREVVVLTVLDKQEEQEQEQGMTEIEMEEMLRLYYQSQKAEETATSAPLTQELLTPETPVTGPTERIRQLEAENTRMRAHLHRIQTSQLEKAFRQRINTLENKVRQFEETKDWLKTTRTLCHREAEVTKLRKAIALCVKALVTRGDSILLQIIAKADPWFIKPEFYEPNSKP